MILHVHIPEKKLNLQALHIYKIKRVYIYIQICLFLQKGLDLIPITFIREAPMYMYTDTQDHGQDPNPPVPINLTHDILLERKAKEQSLKTAVTLVS